MSKLDDLINKLCPDGVEYQTLISIAELKRGERVTKKDLLEEGIYPVISGGVSPMGFMNKKNREPNTITISSYGAAGYVDFKKTEFWANDVCMCVFPKEIIDNKYLFYVLKNQQNYLYANTTKAIPDHIPTQFLENFEIPIPPLEIQNEIVRILDTFTSLEEALEEEFVLRKKQYEYYRDSFLTFDDSVETINLGSLCEIKTGSKPNIILTEKNEYEYINAGTTNSGYCISFNCEGDTVTTPSRG